MKLIVGLGNPGSRYAGTRHNIGFDSITALSDKYRIAVDKKECMALTGRGSIEGIKVLLAKPQTFMNLSGDSVRDLMQYYKISKEDLIVIFDDISLEPGNIRIRKKGSAGGHNGVKSIISCIGTDEFARIKVGVGAKPAQYDLADYVLGHFSGPDEEKIREALKKVVGAAVLMASEETDKAMNIYNSKGSIIE